jgi:hypothetical protein
MPVVSKSYQLPDTDKWPFLALDAEGHDLPPDWFVLLLLVLESSQVRKGICGFAASPLRVSGESAASSIVSRSRNCKTTGHRDQNMRK